jgi:diaminopimelate decarboxylase
MTAGTGSRRYLRERWEFARTNRKGELLIDGVPAAQIAEKYGTPVYVLVESRIRKQLNRMWNSFPYPKLQLQYASKCNSNLEILRICREEGFELDASSVGEIILGLLADFTPEQITFTNLYKSDNDIAFAAQVGVSAITADSLEELERMNIVGQRIGKKIRTFVRINPEIEIEFYSTKKQKYGIPIKQAKQAIDFVNKAKYLDLWGLHFHGAYIKSSKAYFVAAEKLLKLAAYSLKKHKVVRNINLGGGFPIAVGEESVFEPEDFGSQFCEFFERTCRKLGIPLPTLIFEPGKFIVGNAGVGLMRVISKKPFSRSEVLITDASTYSFLPDIMIYKEKYDFLPATKMNKPRKKKYDIAGCTCDFIDVLARQSFMPYLEAGDLLAAMDCGAYSNVMTTNFNTLKKAPMVMVKEDQTTKIIRRRDRYSEMFAPELDVLKVAEPEELMRYYNMHRVNINKIWRGSKQSNGKNNGNEPTHTVVTRKTAKRK